MIGPLSIVLTFLFLAAPQTPSSDALTERVEKVMKSPGYEHARWGFLVVDAATGQTLYERAADELFRPASVTKLFSTAAALVELGPDFRFQTPVVRKGEVDASGTLKGDLILVAKGDLSLGGRTGPEGHLLFMDDDHTYASGVTGDLVPAEPLAGLDHLAREVHDGGIKAITGDVLIDDRLFAPATSTGSGPRRVSPIVVNDNLVDLLVTPGSKPGDPATLRTVPSQSFLNVDFQVETGDEKSKPWIDVRGVGTRGCVVRGTIPAGHKPILRTFGVDQPDDFARAMFIEALRSRGVLVTASALDDNDPSKLPSTGDVAKLPKVAEYLSPPFAEYAKVVLKVSHNLHASTLPLLLASRQPGAANLGSGLRRQGEILKGLGVDLNAISFGGGAGGSPSDLVTPRATVTLLRAMAARKDEFPAYESALPVLGRDGTLAKAVGLESPARGHVRAKTGTFWVVNELTGNTVLTSKALAGYLETAGGRRLVFAGFLNDLALAAKPDNISEATAAANRLFGKVCEALYDSADATPAGK
jgi:D-alanyl-D-alanine carboxypeptidase/D-alanyl-D-alanine-endopeptidase (penicillin-binding protein 4)